VVVIILILGGVIGWFLVQKSQIFSQREAGKATEETFTLSGVVTSVDAKNNFLMVRLNKEEKETKIDRLLREAERIRQEESYTRLEKQSLLEIIFSMIKVLRGEGK
jgi:nitrogen regulatory protein PII-like uncharacterized protein